MTHTESRGPAALTRVRSTKVLFRCLTILLLVLVVAALFPDNSFGRFDDRRAPANAAEREFFETKIRPALAENCFDCHGPDKQKAGLRLDHIETILAGGERGPEVVPGKPDESRLIEAIGYESVDLQMPPRRRLPQETIDALREWVAMGAPWPDEPLPTAVKKEEFDLAARRAEHWAWQTVRNPTPPEVDGEWSRHFVDAFIRARLDAANLQPAPPADERTLLRRLYFDIVGLPPTPDAVAGFLADDSTEAYGKVVDALLASPHFGERWGRHWLDLVRYAETFGHEFDYPIHRAWRYRDYVIRALNADVPYDDFVVEHIAGDLLTNPRRHPTEQTNESIVATGFWHFSQATHAPVDVRNDEAERVANQLDVASKTFLGLTVACARCHDHKFDAISTKDFYALAGFLQSSREHYAFLDPRGKIAAATKKLEAAHAETQRRVAAHWQELRDTDDRVPDYLEAALEALRGTPRADGSDAPARGTFFEDFEKGTYSGWTVEGDAFGPAPPMGTLAHQNPVSGFNGTFLVNSFLGGDRTTGKLTSREFVIEQPVIRFLIGGGAHKRRTCMNLVIDGKVERSATGRNDERLAPEHWDVRDLIGKTAVIEIIDQHKGGWGHINVDDIEFAERARSYRLSRDVGAVARERDLDADLLDRWIAALHDPRLKNRGHPLHSWWALASNESKDRQRTWEGIRNRVSAEAKAWQQWQSESIIFEDFADGPPGDWRATGFAFGREPTERGEWYGAENVPFVAHGVATSGRRGERLQGVLRSPTFTIEHEFIHYRVAGSGGQIRVIIDGYDMDVFNALLFGGISFGVDRKNGFEWHSQRVAKYLGHRAHIEIHDEGNGSIAIDEIRFSKRGAPGHEPLDTAARNLLVTEQWSRFPKALGDLWRRTKTARPDGSIELANWMVHHELAESLEPTVTALKAGREKLRAISGPMPAPIRVLAMTDGTPEDEYVFIRGSHRSRGPVVPRRFLEALGGAPQPSSAGSGRLRLARQMTDLDNPLVARVYVNRVWHHLFGRGLVPTPDDFGVLGTPPTHPELLDALAHWFVTEGEWSTKKLIRLLVTSRTYRMSSKPDDAVAEERDPTNQWLHRMRVRRLQGEVIRDALLAVSAELDDMLFGPPVAIHLTRFMDGRGRPGRSGPLDGNRRRSIYLEVRRNFLSPEMLAFDMPIPYTTIGDRGAANVPAQALILMNNPLVVELASRWGRKIAAEELSDRERVDRIFEVALSRPPTKTERGRILGFVAAQKDGEPSRVWSEVCHVIFNVKEFIYIR